MSVKTSTYSQPYKRFIITIRNQSELVIFLKFPMKKYFLHIELSWQHFYLLSSLEGKENSILFVQILWKAKQSVMFFEDAIIAI